MKHEDVELALSTDLYCCSWIDCFGRRVRIQELAVDKVSKLTESNLTKIESLSAPTEADKFAYEANEAVSEMIRVHTTPDEDLGMSDKLYAEEVADFFYKDETDLLPVPVISGTSPANAQQFLTHIILSLGKYQTEMDALTQHSTHNSGQSSQSRLGRRCH